MPVPISFSKREVDDILPEEEIFDGFDLQYKFELDDRGVQHEFQQFLDKPVDSEFYHGKRVHDREGTALDLRKLFIEVPAEFRSGLSSGVITWRGEGSVDRAF